MYWIFKNESQMASDCILCGRPLMPIYRELPQLMTLQIFVVIGAFVVEEKPIVDIFYTFKDNQRTKRTPMEFCIIMCGDFMTFFYKVWILILHAIICSNCRLCCDLYLLRFTLVVVSILHFDRRIQSVTLVLVYNKV